MAMKGSSLAQCIDEISLKNTDYNHPEQAINQAESLKSLSSDLYTDNIRFIYELIQNADDAEAKNVILTICEDKYLIIAHSGNIFNEKDLQGLCGVNNGTKKKDLNKTGYKGLGFKAVFGKSNKVIIYSNGEYFRFDSSHKINWKEKWGKIDQKTWEKINDRQFIYPWQINPVWTNQNDIPSSINEFLNSKQKQIRVAYAILLNNVEEIHLAINQLKEQPYMFLFLRNISQIKFLTQPNDTISITEDKKHGYLKEVTVNKKVDSQWIIKRFELDVPDDVGNKLSKDSKAPDKLRLIQKAEIFFAAKYKEPIHTENGEAISDSGIEKLRDQDSILFSYLPTKILEYKFPVLINANFLTNVNREQIHADSIWNQWLFEKIGSEIIQWVKELVKNPKFHFQAYRLIPSKLNLRNNILSETFNKSFENSLQKYNFILNRNDHLLKVNEVIMDSTLLSKQSSFININSMRQYIINTENEPSYYSDDPFIDYDSNLKQIGAKEFTWNECIDMFQSEIFLKTHSIENNKRMIEYFYKHKDFNIEQIPFLMDQNTRLQLIKNIYFPAETIGDSGTIDSEDLFVHKTIFIWLNERKQREIKKWLNDIGVEERTDLTYLRKTIIPNASTYSNQENTMKTIKMLFILFQKNLILKKEFDQLKKLKLLTIRGTLVAAEQCFFSDQYKARLQLEEYLKTKEDKFLSFDYVRNKKENEDLAEWRRFFSALGVQEELHPMPFVRKLTSYEAAGYGFCELYLSTASPDGKHSVDAFSGLITITFMQHTKDNCEFARFFWSYVIKNIKTESLKQNTIVYWGHSDKRGATEGTLIENVDYINWFVKNIKCIPTTENTCELASNVFADTKELKDLCGKYIHFPSIFLSQDMTSWNKIFNFKTKLSVNNYFDLLEKIRQDEPNLKNNLQRIQSIYSCILKEIHCWSSDEQKIAKTRVKSIHLLTENDQWKLSSNLYHYMDSNATNISLNEAIPCLKLDYKNRTHIYLNEFLELFNIKQIGQNDLLLADKQSSSAEVFRRKLIEISPFLIKWLESLSVAPDIISSINRKIQQENDFIESDSLELSYNQKFVGKANVYYDIRNKLLYVTRPWDSETTFIDLPNKLCQLLKIKSFDDKLRFLLKGTIDEIKKHFNDNSIEIPTKNDIVFLEPLPRSNVLKQTKPSVPEPNKSTVSIKNVNPTTTIEPLITNPPYNNDPLLVLQPTVPQQPLYPFYEMRPPMENWNRTSTSVFIELPDEQFDNIELMDVSSITTSNFELFPHLSGITGECDESDLQTGRIGEQMVYRYLLNEYRNHPSPVIIKWMNQHRETYLPYDIILTKDGKHNYIEVKSTRTNNQHIFPLSIREIETFLRERQNYFIYRVYIDEQKFVILDNIPWRLAEKHQLDCLLRILPISTDQTR